MHKKALLGIFFLFFTVNIVAQTSFYSGFIDKYPIEVLTNVYSDGVANAIYAYKNFDEPIVIDGALKKNSLVLFEKDASGNKSATFRFEQFDAKNNTLVGTWTDLKSQKTLKVNLTKSFDLDNENEKAWTNREIIQPVSINNKYFKLILSKSADDYSAKVVGVKILEKKTDKLIQQIDLDCQLLGINSIGVGDFNFDGLTDFSVFEASYAGANTSSLYFLLDPKTGEYFNSEFSGVSLEFDPKLKRIYERNSSASSITTATYKVVNNKMVVTERHCLVWNEKKQDYVERPIKECE